MKKWKLLKSVIAFDTKWFKVRKDKVELPDGKILDDYYVWESGDVAMVVPFTKENNLILVKQYKHGASEVMIEYPAGYLEVREEPEETVKRELEEETGFRVINLDFVSKVIHHPTKETGCLHIFIADVERKGSQGNLDISENIEVLELPISRVLSMIKTGQIWATATIASTYLALEKRELLHMAS